MTKLPRHLAHWAPHLELFPTQIAPALGGMVARLAGLIGGWPFDEAAEGEPNGYDGITRNGHYERLLASEWLLLDEMPDEFLRRAVSAEHLFLQRAYRADTATRKCLVLFDAGPEQLGGPRIAHLALLIVLAERAARNNAEFNWAAFQDGSRTLYTGFSKAHVADLLSKRSACAVSSEDIAYWRQLAATDKPELWFVGGKRLAADGAHHGASTVAVSEVLQLDAAPRLQVAVHLAKPSANRAHEVDLDLPPVAATARFLRHPMDLQPTPRHCGPASIDSNSNILFARDGRSLFVRGKGGTLITVRIPNSPRDKVSTQPVVFTPEPDHVILAVGKGGKHTVVVSQCDETLTVYRLSKRGAVARHASRYSGSGLGSRPEPDRLPPLSPLGGCSRKFCFVNQYFELTELTDGSYSNSHADVLSSTSVNSGYFYLSHINGNSEEGVRIKFCNSSHVVSMSAIGLPHDCVYYFGLNSYGRLLCYSPSTSLCTLFWDNKITQFSLPREYTAVGHTHFGDQYEPACVAINGDRTRIVAILGETTETLVTTTEPIAHVAASNASSVIAFITRSGRLGICSCSPHAMLLRPEAGGEQ